MRVLKLAFLTLLALLPAMLFAGSTPTGGSLIASDTFVRSAASDSCGGTQLGSNWCDPTTTWALTSGHVYASNYANGAYYTGATISSTAQYCSFQYGSGLTSSGRGAGCGIRLQSGTGYGYALFCFAGNSTTCTTLAVWRNGSSVGTVSGSWPASSSYFALSGNGNTLTVYVNGSAVGSTISDSNYTSGSVGVVDYNHFSTSSAGSITYWEGGNITSPPNPPTVSPAAGAYPLGVQVSISSCTGTINYTTDGTTPTTGSTAYSASFAVPSTKTVKAICTVSGQSSSAASSAYTVSAPADQTGTSDNLVAYYNANLALQNNLALQTYQHPLDMYWTPFPGGGNWRAVGNISDNTGVNALNFVTLAYLASVGEVGGGCADPSGYPCFASANANRMVMAANTSTSYSADQWSAITPAYQSGAFLSGDPGVIVRGVTTSNALTGYYAWVNPSGGTAEVGEYLNGVKQTAFCNASGLTFTNGGELRLRVAGSYIQATYGGSVIPGCSQSYYDTNITQGNPGVAVNQTGFGYLWHGGNVGSTPVSNATPITNWSYATYADTYNSSWFPHVPWTDISSATSDSHSTQVVATSGVPGATYAQGNGGYTSLLQYVAPFASTGQYQIYEWAQDLFNPNLQNEFDPLMMEGWEPGYASGVCATNGTTAYCNDVVAIYPGVQPSNWGYAQSSSNCASGVGSTHKSEYNCTPFFHITAVSPTLSPDNDVLTVAGSFWTPQKSDYIFSEFLSDGTVAVACKGGGAAAAFQTSHAYATDALFVDSNGNLQHVTTAGTTAGTAPGSWGTTWTATAHAGATTTSGGMTSEYYGQPCPTTTKWGWVIPPTNNPITQSFIGRQGFPATWLGGPGASVSIFPYVTNITMGTATSSFACTMDSNLCYGGEQPHSWLPF